MTTQCGNAGPARGGRGITETMISPKATQHVGFLGTLALPEKMFLERGRWRSTPWIGILLFAGAEPVGLLRWRSFAHVISIPDWKGGISIGRDMHLSVPHFSSLGLMDCRR